MQEVLEASLEEVGNWCRHVAPRITRVGRCGPAVPKMRAIVMLASIKVFCCIIITAVFKPLLHFNKLPGHVSPKRYPPLLPFLPAL